MPHLGHRGYYSQNPEGLYAVVPLWLFVQDLPIVSFVLGFIINSVTELKDTKMTRIRLAILAASLSLSSLAFADVVNATGDHGAIEPYSALSLIDGKGPLIDIEFGTGSTTPGEQLSVGGDIDYSDFYSGKSVLGWRPDEPPYGRWSPDPVPEPSYGFLLVGGLVAAVVLKIRGSARRA